jgi:hypothetical protein
MSSASRKRRCLRAPERLAAAGLGPCGIAAASGQAGGKDADGAAASPTRAEGPIRVGIGPVLRPGGSTA